MMGSISLLPYVFPKNILKHFPIDLKILLALGHWQCPAMLPTRSLTDTLYCTKVSANTWIDLLSSP